MVNDAKDHEDEDKQKREEITLRNSADSLCWQTEKHLGDFKDKLDEELRSEVESKIKSVRDALAANDIATVKTEMEGLTQASHKMSQKMYEQGAAAPGEAGAEGAAAADNGHGHGNNGATKDSKSGPQVVDAEFEESN